MIIVIKGAPLGWVKLRTVELEHVSSRDEKPRDQNLSRSRVGSSSDSSVFVCVLSCFFFDGPGGIQNS